MPMYILPHENNEFSIFVLVIYYTTNYQKQCYCSNYNSYLSLSKYQHRGCNCVSDHNVVVTRQSLQSVEVSATNMSLWARRERQGMQQHQDVVVVRLGRFTKA